MLRLVLIIYVCVFFRNKKKMNKSKDSPNTEPETEEEFSVEKVLDRRVVKGKVNNGIYLILKIKICI